MRSRGWLLLLGALAFPPLAPAQTVKESDLFGGWRGQMETIADRMGTWPGWMVLLPGGLWMYTAIYVNPYHGGARWRLVGDTLWLANDYRPYFHSLLADESTALAQKHNNAIGVVDMDIAKRRAPYPVPDSIYWSKAFRDTTTTCDLGGGTCPTWVYKVSMRGDELHLDLLENLSWRPEWGPVRATLKRDSIIPGR